MAQKEVKIVYDHKYFLNALTLYYQKLFPVNLIYDWLKYDDNINMEKREITFELIGRGYLRYRSFESQEEFRHYILKKIPMKIDIGAVYNAAPRDLKFINALKPVEKELVFDIDMTDYDDVRTCCNDANICNKCWKFLCVACKILHAVLVKDFGFKHILWVFSGRRGIHCWVCDKKARQLSNYERQCILSYMNIINGGIHISRKVKLPNTIHSSIQRALQIINTYFEDCIVKEQNVLGTETGLNKFLKLICDAPKSFEEVICRYETSEERWQAFKTHLNNLQENNSLPSSIKYLKEEIILHFMYPRFDCTVTTKKEHLLKSPFSIHPKTRKIAIPFNPKSVDLFDLDQVPTIDLVLDELHKHFGESNKEERTCAGNNDSSVNITFTSLSKAFSCFQQFVRTREQGVYERMYSW